MTFTLRRRGLAGAAALGLVLAGLVLGGSGPASAAPVTSTIDFRCTLTMFGVGYVDDQTIPVTTEVTATAVPSGTDVEVTYSLEGALPTNAPVALGNVRLQTRPEVTARASDETGPTASAVGLGSLTAPTDVAAHAELPVPSEPISVLVPTSDFDGATVVDLRPGTLTLDIVDGDDGIGGSSMSCVPDASPVIGSVTVGDPPALPSQCDVIDPVTGCATGQDLEATLSAGSLSQQAVATGTNPDATSVVFPTVQVESIAQSLTAPFNTVTVTDTRGGAYAMSLVATLHSPLRTAGGTELPADALSIGGLACTGTAESAPALVGAGGALDGGVTLCQTSAGVYGPNESTSGVYAVSGTYTLDLPAFAAAGIYQGTVTVLLS